MFCGQEIGFWYVKNTENKGNQANHKFKRHFGKQIQWHITEF